MFPCHNVLMSCFITQYRHLHTLLWSPLNGCNKAQGRLSGPCRHNPDCALIMFEQGNTLLDNILGQCWIAFSWDGKCWIAFSCDEKTSQHGGKFMDFLLTRWGLHKMDDILRMTNAYTGKTFLYHLYIFHNHLQIGANWQYVSTGWGNGLVPKHQIRF